MHHVNPAYLTKQVKQFVGGLITDYGYKSYNDLSDDEKCELASYLIEASGRSAEHEFLTESNLLDQTINAFRRALRDGTPDANERFVDIIKENTVDYFDDTMREIFDDIRNYE